MLHNTEFFSRSFREATPDWPPMDHRHRYVPSAGYAEIVWLGHVVAASGDGTRVEVLLKDPDRHRSLAATVIGTAGVGRLHSMVWGRGATAEPTLQALAEDPVSRFRHVWCTGHLDRDTMRIARLDQLNLHEPALLDVIASPKFGTTRVCIVFDQAPPIRRCIVIPCWEIVRYFYSARGVLSKLLFTGQLDPAFLLDRIEKVCFDGARFTTYTDFIRSHKQNDFPLYDGYAAHQACEIFRRAVVSYRQEGLAAIEAVPPILGNVALRCIGITSMIDDFEAFVILRIAAARRLECDEFQWNGPLGIHWSANDGRLYAPDSPEIDYRQIHWDDLPSVALLSHNAGAPVGAPTS